MELHQEVGARADQTIPVWQTHFGDLIVSKMNGSGLRVLADALPLTAQLRDNKLQQLDDARQVRDLIGAQIHLLVVKVPALIGASLSEEPHIIADLDKVYAIVPETFAASVARARKLVPVWKAANAFLAAQSPALSPITRNGKTVANLEALILQAGPSESVVAILESEAGTIRGTLRRDSLRVGRINKAAYKGMSALADSGTPGFDALGTISTEGTSLLPDTLGIRSISQGGVSGLQVLVNFEPSTIEPDETRELQFLRDGIDADWTTVPAGPNGNAFGPFVVGQTIRVRTSVTNSHGTRNSGPRRLIIQPVEL